MSAKFPRGGGGGAGPFFSSKSNCFIDNFALHIFQFQFIFFDFRQISMF